MLNSKTNRNDPCPCGSGKKYKKCCLNKKGPKIQSRLMNDTIDAYKKSSQWFQDILDERTDDEIKYDNIVLRELNNGKPIRKALDIASEQYPDEALEYDDDNIDEIYAHYDYFVNHVKIIKRIQELSN